MRGPLLNFSNLHLNLPDFPPKLSLLTHRSRHLRNTPKLQQHFIRYWPAAFSETNSAFIKISEELIVTRQQLTDSYYVTRRENIAYNDKYANSLKNYVEEKISWKCSRVFKYARKLSRYLLRYYIKPCRSFLVSIRNSKAVRGTFDGVKQWKIESISITLS